MTLIKNLIEKRKEKQRKRIIDGLTQDITQITSEVRERKPDIYFLNNLMSHYNLLLRSAKRLRIDTSQLNKRLERVGYS